MEQGIDQSDGMGHDPRMRKPISNLLMICDRREIRISTSQHNARINKYPVDKYRRIRGGKDSLFLFYTE